MTCERILLVLDGSPRADRALAEAVGLARSEGAHLTLMAVVAPVPWSAYFAPPASARTVGADALVKALEIIRRARDRVPPDVGVTAVLGNRSVRHAVMREINGGEYDLLLIGLRTPRFARSTRLAGATRYVLRGSPSPAVALRDGAIAIRSRRILAGSP